MQNITVADGGDPLYLIEKFIELGLLPKDLSIKEGNVLSYKYLNKLFCDIDEKSSLSDSVFPMYLLKHIRYNFLVCGEHVSTLESNICKHNLDVLMESVDSPNFAPDKSIMINVGLQDILYHSCLFSINRYIRKYYSSINTDIDVRLRYGYCTYHYNSELQTVYASILDYLPTNNLTSQDNCVKTYTLKIDETTSLLLKLTNFFKRTTIYQDSNENYHMILTVTPYEVKDAIKRLRINDNMCEDISLKDEILIIANEINEIEEE